MRSIEPRWILNKIITRTTTVYVNLELENILKRRITINRP